MRGVPEIGQHAVGAIGQIGCGVDQGTVEVDHDHLDGDRK